MILDTTESDLAPEIREIRAAVADGNGGRIPLKNLPFTPGDVTCGLENEMQAAVLGAEGDVDLPLSLTHSGFFRNLNRRVASGDAPPEMRARIERYLRRCGNVWPNSRVLIPLEKLSAGTLAIIEKDLRADKDSPNSPPRADRDDFSVERNGKKFLRVPVSYLRKISLAEALAPDDVPAAARALFDDVQKAFICDNTSPELLSFFPLGENPAAGKASADADSAPRGGSALFAPAAQETALRLTLCQLLIFYANERLGLREHGQRALLYMSSHVPVAQQEINELVPDSFYRDLFMNPCLNGWARGEEKLRYMRLCHKVLSRSHLNILAKLRNAGIITRNLVVLPNTSNASLATNGTHITIGSRVLTRAAKEKKISPAAEKYAADLVSKAMEHFLPLFVGEHTAAPFRLGFENFHPEKALGFLAHELDFTQLRMIWRRWKKKAKLSVFGWRLTPFGPAWIDAAVAKIFRLRGDFIPDFRLVDYFMTLLSTDESPSLDGTIGNAERLKKDLCDLGIFDPAMSVYTLFRQRDFAKYGFCGFEGRHYSLFPRIRSGVTDAVRLQCALAAALYRMALAGTLRHEDIPDTPGVESERRQIFFSRAVGLPTFYVRENSGNAFLERILAYAKRTRKSRRYPGYIRVKTKDYCLAAIDFIRIEARETVALCGAGTLLETLRMRILENGEDSAAGTLAGEVCRRLRAKSPLDVPAETFNRETENYCRESLRRAHFAEGAETARDLLGESAGADFMRNMDAAFDGNASPETLRALIAEMLRALETLRKKFSP